MTETAEKTTHSWWASPRFLLCAAAVLLLVFIGIVLAATMGKDDDTPAEASPPSQPAQPGRPGQTTTPGADDPQESVCGLDATGGVTLTAAPLDVEWEFLNGIYAPESKEHGPGVVDPDTGVRSCFSHTPEGALLAVAGLFVSGGDPQLLLETIEKQTLEGPGKDKSLAGVQARIDRGDSTIPPIEVVGFRLLSYNEDEASVEVVLGADAGQEKYYQTQSANIIWQNGDWYFRAPGDSTSVQISGQINSLSGYALWGPNNG